jgi:hypothetical protein
MRNPAELSHVELTRIVSAIQDLLFLDLVDDREVYNPGKDWQSCYDVCSGITSILHPFGLVPGDLGDDRDAPMPPKSRVIVSIADNAVHLLEAPEGMEVIVRDYDVDSCDDATWDEPLKVDEDGDQYQEIPLTLGSRVPQPATLEVKYVLYNIDTGDLASNHVYADRGEAVEDASQLNDVIVVPLAFETR